jgi:2-polyprenyl-3-methyl-5-hydroxy-6-metoxy-1,4-benzoquinol methylase
LRGYGKVLDGGCGYGIGTLALACVNHYVIGVDYDEDCINLTSRLFSEKNSQFYIPNVTFTSWEFRKR